MDTPIEQGAAWTPLQTYVLAIICLVLGIIAGYLLHAPATSSVPKAPEQAQSGTPPDMPGQGPIAEITPEQFKHMADKTAEPLLAELQNNPNDAALLARIAATYFVARQYQSAAEYYDRAAVVKSDPAVLTQLATTCYYLGDADKAIATLQQALAVDPKYADALFNLGMLEWEAKSNPKAAIVAWEKLLKTNPHHPKRAQVERVIARAKRHINIPSGTKSAKPVL